MTIKIDKMRALLEAKQAELRESLANLTEVYSFADRANHDVQDVEEAAAGLNETENQWLVSENQRKLLTEVEEALKRIEQGTYGFCTLCKLPISEMRLEILPWATCDVVCQKQLEARESESPVTVL
jgi:DnaK suppressor protein